MCPSLFGCNILHPKIRSRQDDGSSGLRGNGSRVRLPATEARRVLWSRSTSWSDLECAVDLTRKTPANRSFLELPSPYRPRLSDSESVVLSSQRLRVGTSYGSGILKASWLRASTRAVAATPLEERISPATSSRLSRVRPTMKTLAGEGPGHLSACCSTVDHHVLFLEQHAWPPYAVHLAAALVVRDACSEQENEETVFFLAFDSTRLKRPRRSCGCTDRREAGRVISISRPGQRPMHQASLSADCRG